MDSWSSVPEIGQRSPTYLLLEITISQRPLLNSANTNHDKDGFTVNLIKLKRRGPSLALFPSRL